jgi:hypothetical protein
MLGDSVPSDEIAFRALQELWDARQQEFVYNGAVFFSDSLRVSLSLLTPSFLDLGSGGLGFFKRWAYLHMLLSCAENTS